MNLDEPATQVQVMLANGLSGKFGLGMVASKSISGDLPLLVECLMALTRGYGGFAHTSIT